MLIYTNRYNLCSESALQSLQKTAVLSATWVLDLDQKILRYFIPRTKVQLRPNWELDLRILHIYGSLY